MSVELTRYVFYVSDSTGITVEGIGRSVLSQFSDIEFIEKTVSFVDNQDKVDALVKEINTIESNYGTRPIVFFTCAPDSFHASITQCNALTMNCLEMFIKPLSIEFNQEPLHNKPNSKLNNHKRLQSYQRRIDALNYTMNNDDGISVRNFNQAELILVGVSRSGKTPTSLYLALHYGIFTANYPLVDEDFANDSLPLPLKAHLSKLYGLLISPKRLAEIRAQRRPGSRYAELKKCQDEVSATRRIFDASGIRYLDVTSRSVEELSSKILQDANIQRFS